MKVYRNPDGVVTDLFLEGRELNATMKRLLEKKGEPCADNFEVVVSFASQDVPASDPLNKGGRYERASEAVSNGNRDEARGASNNGAVLPELRPLKGLQTRFNMGGE